MSVLFLLCRSEFDLVFIPAGPQQRLNHHYISYGLIYWRWSSRKFVPFCISPCSRPYSQWDITSMLHSSVIESFRLCSGVELSSDEIWPGQSLKLFLLFLCVWLVVELVIESWNIILVGCSFFFADTASGDLSRVLGFILYAISSVWVGFGTFHDATGHRHFGGYGGGGCGIFFWWSS